MFCKNCGAQLPDGTLFCVRCGADLMQSNPYHQQQQYQQPPYQQPYQYPYTPSTHQPAQGFAIASLVLGIVSIFLFSIIAGPLAIIFGVVAKNKGNRSSMATAGIICGIIGIVSYFIMIIILQNTIFALF